MKPGVKFFFLTYLQYKIYNIYNKKLPIYIINTRFRINTDRKK